MSNTILTLVGSYLPGYKGGGPVRSIENLAAVLGGEFNFKIVTMDRDLRDTVPYPNIVVDEWVRVGQAEVLYIRPGWRGVIRLTRLLCSVNRDMVVYLNSFFSRRFSMLAVLLCWLGLCRPRSVVLAPRGEFSPGALSLKKGRKRMYIKMARLLGAYRSVIWHANTILDSNYIGAMFRRPTHIAPAISVVSANGHRELDPTGAVPAAQDDASLDGSLSYNRRRKRAGELRVVFLSRISPKKNLVGALRLLGGASGDVVFDIYGPVEDSGYWAECQKLISVLPANVRVKYCGEIEHENVNSAFAEHDLFLFPTLGENYGHVICEALAAGCPVLLSDQTPWRNLEQEGAGWDVPLSEVERFRAILQRCIDADDEWYSALSARAAIYAEKHMFAPGVIEANRRLFRYAFNAAE